jgi:tRNA 2-thiouridine synthesizing protein C
MRTASLVSGVEPVTRKLLYVFRSAPHGTIIGQEGLDVLLTGGAFEQDVSILFMDDGVFQLLKGQDTSAIGSKDYARAFGALGDFCETLEHGDGVFVESLSLAQRGLGPEDLVIPVKVLEHEAIHTLFEAQHAVLNF